MASEQAKHHIDASLNIREMLSGDVNRLRYVQRFSMSHVVHKENVAEHSYYVCLYAWLIGKWVNEYHDLPSSHSSGVDMENLLIKALIHDLEECRTGDFSRIFKYSNPDLTRMIALQSGHELCAVFNGIWNNIDKTDSVWRKWVYAKDSSSLEGKILAFADFLAVLAYVVAEINNANASMMQHYSTLSEYFQQFCQKEYDFLNPLVVQTDVIVRQMVEKLENL